LVEFAAFFAVAIAAPLGVWMALTITFAHAPDLWQIALRAGLTAATYPFAVLAFRWVLRVSARRDLPQPFARGAFEDAR
jgi:hypothetical protein